jgi:hypothetical protein
MVRSRGYDPRKTVVPFEGSQRLWLTRFLNCKTSQDFLGYAKHYGALGLATRLGTPIRVNGTLVTHAESLQIWHDAHKLISTAASLWEASVAGKAQEVGVLLSPAEAGSLSIELDMEVLAICGTRHFEYREGAPEGVPTRGDLLAFGRRASTTLVNAVLRDHSSPHVLMPKTGHAALLVTAHNKLGAMAGELSLWMTGVRRYAICPGCQDWNDVTSSHPSRQYCSGSRGVSCRKRHSRKRIPTDL